MGEAVDDLRLQPFRVSVCSSFTRVHLCSNNNIRVLMVRQSFGELASPAAERCVLVLLLDPSGSCPVPTARVGRSRVLSVIGMTSR
jgi:hypothetical protein